MDDPISRAEVAAQIAAAEARTDTKFAELHGDVRAISQSIRALTQLIAEVRASLRATQALVVDVLPAPPGNIARTFVGAMRLLSPFRAEVPASMRVVRLAPPKLLGAPLEAIYWTRANAESWIRAGEEQGAAIKHSIANCFARE